jgi:hypothetical protein
MAGQGWWSLMGMAADGQPKSPATADPHRAQSTLDMCLMHRSASGMWLQQAICASAVCLGASLEVF